MQLPLAASCIVLGGLPIHIAFADSPRALEGPQPLLLRMDHQTVLQSARRDAMDAISGYPDSAAVPMFAGHGSIDPKFTVLRLDKDPALLLLKPEPAAKARGFDPIEILAGEGPRKIKAVLGGSVIRDSNVLRLPASVEPQQILGLPSRADTLHVAVVGVSIDKEYSLQRFQLDVTETAYRYASFSFLNFDALEYRGAWHWRLTPRWGGTLSTEHRVGVASSADTQIAQRTQLNLRTADNLRLTLDGSLSGGWHALLGAFQSQLKYDRSILPQNSSRTRGVEAGVKYESAAGNAITALQRSVQGDYLNRVADAATFSDNAYRQNEFELKLDWNASGKSAVNGRLAWVEVRHDHFKQRDFSGLAGELGYAWSPTSKLRVEISGRRDISSWWQTFSSYRIDDALSVAPTWQVSAKTSVRMRLERVRSDFRGPVFPPVEALRYDHAQTALLGVEWNPLHSLVLDASLQRQRRSSNTTGVDFDANIASLNARLKF